MKLEVYHEALTKEFERFTFIAVQLRKHPDGEYYMNICFLGFNLLIIFSNSHREKFEQS